MIKNVKIRVIPEETAKIQKVVFDNNGSWDNNLKFNQIKDLEIIFLKDNYKAKVLISSESFNHYNYFTEEYKTLSENVRNSYKRSLTEALKGLENEYVKEMETSFQRYMNRIYSFLKNIDQEIKR